MRPLCWKNIPRSESAFDELLADDGRVRPHYAKLFHTLEELGEVELKRRWSTCLQLVHEQGIYYNVYGDPRGMERPWQMDPIPLVIAPEEWRSAGNRPDPARDAAQQNPCRLPHPAGINPFALAFSRAGFCAAGFFASLPRHSCAARYLSAFLCRRPRAFA